VAFALCIYIMIYDHQPPDISSLVRSLSTRSVASLGQKCTGYPLSHPVEINNESGCAGPCTTLLTPLYEGCCWLQDILLLLLFDTQQITIYNIVLGNSGINFSSCDLCTHLNQSPVAFLLTFVVSIFQNITCKLLQEHFNPLPPNPVGRIDILHMQSVLQCQ